MKKVSAVLLVATISFFITTATSEKKGIEFEYRQDTFGWPNTFCTVTYEKAEITNLVIDWQALSLNFLLCFVVVGAIRLMFLFMKVKRTPLEELNAKSAARKKQKGLSVQ